MKLAWRNIFPCVLPALMFFVSAPATAQYVWTDSNNVRHYSDKPPPASIPASRIIRTPRSGPALTYEPVSKDAQAAKKPDSPANATKASLSTAEKNAEFQKRRMEQAEKDKRAEQEAKRAEEKQKYCESQQEHRRTLQSGQRLARLDKNGERYYMTDEQRARKLEEANRSLEKCK